jgi:hypothetical protein
MVYHVSQDDEHIVIPDGPVSAREVRKIIKEKKSADYYELEAAEVINCYLDDEDLPFVPETGERDYSQYGWIEARMLISNKGVQDTIIARPLNSDIKRYPYPNEYVIIAEYFGQFFYTQKINLRNRTDTNIVAGLSKTAGAFSLDIQKENLPIIENPTIRTLNAEEGDITFEGRFGNTIRLGSNVKEIKTQDGVEENTGKQNSPNVIIRTGQGVEESVANKPVKEDVNKDSSSLWMTTDQVVPFERSSQRAHGNTVPNQYDGKQIIINSDRIVFNSKVNSIHAFSKSEISMGADVRMNLESPIVNLADRMATQPALAGDITMDLIDKLLDALVDFASGIAPSMATCISFKIPIDSIMGPSMQLAATLRSLKTRMDEPKSRTVFVGNPKGPSI